MVTAQISSLENIIGGIGTKVDLVYGAMAKRLPSNSLGSSSSQSSPFSSDIEVKGEDDGDNSKYISVRKLPISYLITVCTLSKMPGRVQGACPP